MSGEVLGVNQSGHLSGPCGVWVGHVTHDTSWMTVSRLGQSRNLIVASDASGKGGEVNRRGSAVAKARRVELARGTAEHTMGVSAERAVRRWRERERGTSVAAAEVERDKQQEQEEHHGCGAGCCSNKEEVVAVVVGRKGRGTVAEVRP